MTTAAAALLAIAAFFYLFFVRKQDIPAPVPVSPVQHLEDRKQAIYENLRDLQFEYRLGKLSDEDYAATKKALQRELAVVLSDMEETARSLGVGLRQVPANAAAATGKTKCPHCGASFAQALKFCGECGKQMV